MAVKATAAAAAEAWQNGMAGAGAKYTAGINAVQTAPGQLAAAQKQLYLANVQAQANTWASRVASVDLQTWKNAATTTGAARLATGATKGAPKVAAFQQAFLPVLSGIVSGLPSRGSYEQNIQRFTSYANALHSKKGSF